MIVKTPEPPYVAVIFTSLLNENISDYEFTFNKMMDLAKKIDGFIGMESARSELGISVSYWSSVDAVKEWQKNSDHLIAKKIGKEKFYKSYALRIARVRRDKFFNV